jgi:hypothetical protein
MRKRKILISVAGVFLAAAVFVAVTFRNNYCPPILMYHSVSPAATAANRLDVCG